MNFNTNNSANVNYDNGPEGQSMIINQVGSIETKYNQVYSAYLPDEDHFEPNDIFSDASKICPDGDIPAKDMMLDDDTLAAVWISDFLPCDNTSIFYLTSEYVYYIIIRMLFIF